jgi:sulfate-transporting ATPase
VSAAVVGGARSGRPGDGRAILERLGLDELRDRHADELSQGERQVVSIARACARSPDALLLDEPAAGLDTIDTKRLGARIRDLAAGGTAVLLVDHDIALVLTVCDYIYVLDFGKVISEGSPDTIRRDPLLTEAYLGTYDASVAT